MTRVQRRRGQRAQEPVTGGRDFDLHGIVGIRLVDAQPGDVATVLRQLGPLQRDFDRTPDLTIRFVDRCIDEADHPPLTYAGMGEGAFDDEAFYLLRGRGQVTARAMIPFDRIGQPLEIICERRMPAVPHLLTLINLTALTKGVLPLHASAFTAGDTGVLVTGWSKGGKTEALLGCMGEGAAYVGDEWVYLTDDGRMLGLPEPIRLWSWQLQQLPHLLRARPLADRARLRAWAAAAAAMARVSRSRLPRTGLLERCRPVVGRQAYLQIPPVDLFGPDAVTLEGRLDAVVLVASGESPRTDVIPVEAADIAGRMAASLSAERAMFLEHYQQFRYAFPDRGSDVVDKAEQLELALLHALLHDTPAAMVVHPYPCRIDDLGRTVLAAARGTVR